uniref:Si:ch211-133n4.6 n=1 Tax=Cyprinus carpio carpio TaxID=630221 RepID=A0A9J7YVZ3_CYPCA
MLTRNVLILCSLALVLVKADIEAADGGSQAMFATDPDSTSDEAPTESMNLLSPDLPNDELLYNGATADASSTSAEAGAPQVKDVPKADAAKSSMEEPEEDEAPDSEEAAAAAAVKPAPVPVQRATKSHNASARKRSKPVPASKKRSRNLRP